jgi:L-ascorbate metabolism protein UlaG (beta-lactamase superfamily)
LTHVHTDPDTILPLPEASLEALFVAPFTSRGSLVEAGLVEGRVVVPEIGEPFEISGATVTAVPSAHTWGTSSSGTV